MYNYEDFLRKQLYLIKNEQGFEDLHIEVTAEEVFAKEKTFKPSTMYVIVKFLQSDITFGAISKPFNIVSICEQNNLERCKAILDIFATTWNFKTEVITNETNTDIYKHSYSTPVIISNFDEVGYGFRTVLYTSGTLTVLESVADITNFKYWVKSGNSYQALDITPLRIDVGYTMTPNTQQRAGEPIATSMKSTAILTLSLIVPLLDNTFTQRVMSIIKEDTNGNGDFVFTYKWGGYDMGYEVGSKPYKLTSASITTIAGEVPSLVLSFVR